MAYNGLIAERVRKQLSKASRETTEKKMFGGLAFIVDGKMCINVSGDNLMCRYDPLLEEKVKKRKGYLPMVMKGKIYKGYCYVESFGFKSDTDFEYWINLCLNFNEKLNSSSKTE